MGSQFLDNCSTDSEKVYSFGNYDSMASFPLVGTCGTFLLVDLEKGISNGLADGYVLRRWLIAITMHYINGWCRIVVVVNSNSPMRVDALHGNA